MLEALGLDADTERLYQALLNNPDLSTAAAARAAGLNRRSATECLAVLEAKGLVAHSATSPAGFAATPPDLAVGRLIMERQRELEDVRLAVPRLVEQFRASTDQTGLFQLVELVPGGDAVAQRFQILQTTAKQEIVGLDKPPYAMEVGPPNEAELDGLARGVRYRIIYDPTALEVPGMVELLERYARAGEETRILEGLPIKLAMADRSLGLVPIDTSADTIQGAVFLHESSLLSALYDLFERLWEAARPLVLPGVDASPPAGDSPPEGEGLSPVEARILVLLRAGLKDQAIAAQLGLAISTVERRIRRLMQTLGARSRFQAGAEAAARGWLDQH
jgi:DNA-binding CsgD family transcriptional regulator/sugar-specific transcriptional regulator TrmB